MITYCDPRITNDKKVKSVVHLALKSALVLYIKTKDIEIRDNATSNLSTSSVRYFIA